MQIWTRDWAGRQRLHDYKIVGHNYIAMHIYAHLCFGAQTCVIVYGCTCKMLVPAQVGLMHLGIRMPDAGLGNNGQRYEPGPDIFLRHAGISDKYVLGSHIRTCSVLNGTSLGFQFKLLNNLLPMLHERRQWKRIELEAGNTPKAARHCQAAVEVQCIECNEYR